MPTYEYKCQKCDYVNEIMHSMSESAESLGLKCEKCENDKLERLISAPFIGNTKSSSSSSCPTGTCPLT